ncbi:MAG: VPLPA-CTERM sorting domain-containing protein [Arenibacterium sp.]
MAAIDGRPRSAVNGTGGTAGNPPPINFFNLSAGDYRLSVYQTGDPSTAEFYFRITETVAPVPLPAAGWLLLGGIGGLAAMRRRKRV